jgi:SAM-dependent methyltransferase
MSTDKMRYGFGKNWENYIKKHFSKERVEISKKQMLAFLNLENLDGKYFLDIGCGSGLQSLAALRAGAARVVSFDYDPNSVTTTKMLRGFAGNPEHWQVMQGSILDDEFLKSIEPADIVHSWGVLHHTGNMWRAMDNTSYLAKKDALLYIALYDYEIQVDPSPEFWLDVKRRYNQSDESGKRRMEIWYIWRFDLRYNPLRLPIFLFRVLSRKYRRGMDLFIDIKDWLGGWPMEFAKRADVKAWAEKHGMKMLTMKTGQANTEYLFKKQ